MGCQEVVNQFTGEYRWLSNFWPAPVVLDGVTYPTVEHAYQAAKTTDPQLRNRVPSVTPGDAKRLSRTFPLRADWAAVKLAVMEGLLRQKFHRPDLRATLVETTGELVEGNRWGDTFWGVDLRTGTGQNHLGRLLMMIRDELRSAQKCGRSG